MELEWLEREWERKNRGLEGEGYGGSPPGRSEAREILMKLGY